MFGVFILNLLVYYCLEVSKVEFLFLLSSTFAIGISEYINTAVEALADRVTLEREEIIKRVKDLAAGATFCASTLTVIVCVVIFIPKLIEKFEIAIYKNHQFNSTSMAHSNEYLVNANFILVVQMQ